MKNEANEIATRVAKEVMILLQKQKKISSQFGEEFKNEIKNKLIDKFPLEVSNENLSFGLQLDMFCSFLNSKDFLDKYAGETCAAINDALKFEKGIEPEMLKNTLVLRSKLEEGLLKQATKNNCFEVFLQNIQETLAAENSLKNYQNKQQISLTDLSIDAESYLEAGLSGCILKRYESKRAISSITEGLNDWEKRMDTFVEGYDKWRNASSQLRKQGFWEEEEIAIESNSNQDIPLQNMNGNHVGKLKDKENQRQECCVIL